MKIQINNQVFDSNDVPICLILSDEEKQHLANLGDSTKYASFPDSCFLSVDDKLRWMNGEFNPLEGYIEIYFDTAKSMVCVRSGCTTLNYTNGTKLEVSLEYFVINCIKIHTELKDNPIKFSDICLRKSFVVGTVTFSPTSVLTACGITVANINYKHSGTVSQEDWESLEQFRQWVKWFEVIALTDIVDSIGQELQPSHVRAQ